MIAREILNLFDQAVHAPRPVHHARANRGQHDVLVAPLDQFDAKLILKFFELRAERWLTDVAALCRLAKVPGLVQSDEVLKGSEVHSGFRRGRSG